MKILWLSWRDIKNPDAGGAEKVAIEVASRFVRDRDNVTIFTSRFKGAKPQEVLRRVKIIRRGNRLTCRLYAFIYYFQNRAGIDLIIDEINTIPFFTVLYAKNKTITLIHQLAKEYWFTQTIWPISLIGFWLEPFWLKLYKNKPALALSASTKADLVNLGFTNVKIYQIGLDFKPKLITKKENLILFIGRLVRAKTPDDALIAFKKIKSQVPNSKLIIVGKGKIGYINSLKTLTKKLNIAKYVEFTGFISESLKFDLLKRAKVILIPSIREGWSLVATEANALGCVPVGYNIPGLRDSIKNNHNGILVNKNPQELAEGALLLLKDEKLRFKLAQIGYNKCKKISWENCYQDIKRYIVKDYASTKITKLGNQL